MPKNKKALKLKTKKIGSKYLSLQGKIDHMPAEEQ